MYRFLLTLSFYLVAKPVILIIYLTSKEIIFFILFDIILKNYHKHKHLAKCLKFLSSSPIHLTTLTKGSVGNAIYNTYSKTASAVSSASNGPTGVFLLL